jgi:hypothetical protein
MSKKLLYIISPFLLGFGFCLHLTLNLMHVKLPADRIRCGTGIAVFMILAAFLLIGDLVLRIFIRDAIRLWIIEIVSILLFFIFALR